MENLTLIGIIIAIIAVVIAYLQYFHPRYINEEKQSIQNANQTIVIVNPDENSKSIIPTDINRNS